MRAALILLLLGSFATSALAAEAAEIQIQRSSPVMPTQSRAIRRSMAALCA